jgi:hypothetical protein
MSAFAFNPLLLGISTRTFPTHRTRRLYEITELPSQQGSLSPRLDDLPRTQTHLHSHSLRDEAAPWRAAAGFGSSRSRPLSPSSSWWPRSPPPRPPDPPIGPRRGRRWCSRSRAPTATPAGSPPRCGVGSAAAPAPTPACASTMISSPTGRYSRIFFYAGLCAPNSWDAVLDLTPGGWLLLYCWFRYYTTRLYIGTPPQEFALIVDSGSTVTYVPCASCEQCGNHQVSLSPLLPYSYRFETVT